MNEWMNENEWMHEYEMVVAGERGAVCVYVYATSVEWETSVDRQAFVQMARFLFAWNALYMVWYGMRMRTVSLAL